MGPSKRMSLWKHDIKEFHWLRRYCGVFSLIYSKWPIIAKLHILKAILYQPSKTLYHPCAQLHVWGSFCRYVINILYIIHFLFNMLWRFVHGKLNTANYFFLVLRGDYFKVNLCLLLYYSNTIQIGTINCIGLISCFRLLYHRNIYDNEILSKGKSYLIDFGLLYCVNWWHVWDAPICIHGCIPMPHSIM